MLDRGYCVCSNAWLLDDSIKNEVRLLAIISSYTAEKGYCFASNKHFAELFKTTEVSISRKIKKLESKGYINIQYEYRGCEITSRKIRLTEMITDDYQKCYSTINKNVKDNNTSINNTSINNNVHFENFWNEYPRKINKKSARTKFDSILKTTSIDVIMKGLENYKQHIKQDNVEERYIKHPTTWLNNECWNDEYQIKEQPIKQSTGPKYMTSEEYDEYYKKEVEYWDNELRLRGILE